MWLLLNAHTETFRFFLHLAFSIVKTMVIHRASYLTHIEGYMERDIFYLYTTAPPFHG